MNYRKIEFGGKYIKELELTLKQIAKWHNETPKLWIPNYKASEEDIEETVEKIINTRTEDLFIAIAEDGQENIQGFIWACKEKENKDSVMILSLYVEKDYRHSGIATNLKISLEEWCRIEGIKTIQTTVSYKNEKMLMLNQKLGYMPGMVHMTKSL